VTVFYAIMLVFIGASRDSYKLPLLYAHS